MSDIEVQVKSPLSSTPYSLEVSVEDTVSSIKQYLLSLGLLEQPLTSFSLLQNNEPVSNDASVGDLVGSEAKNLNLQMGLQKLTLIDVNAQLEQLRDILGLGFSGSSYVNGGATRLYEIKRGSKKGKKLTEDELVEIADLPDFDLSSATDDAAAVTVTAAAKQPNLEGKGGSQPDSASISGKASVSEPNALLPKPAAIELGFSHWQPLCRSAQVKLKGIIAFIKLISNDRREWHFAASHDGYAFVPGLNDQELHLPSANTRFVPSLIQAIEQASPSSINAARKNGEKIKANPLACVPIPQVSSVAPWLVGNIPQISQINVSNLQQPAESSLRDWNEDYQSTRELEAESFSERILRDRSLCQTATEFASAATEGAINIVEGAITALDPYEEVESAKLFLSKGIFYTYGSDFAQAYAGIDSESAAKKAVKKGVHGVEQLMMLNNPKLSPVLTAVIDYCGRRIVAQAPVPGIFREIPLIVYGQSEEPGVVHFDEEVDEYMKQFAQNLHLKQHPVTPEGLELQTSAEVHGAKSTDGRVYAIDLHRMQPPDLLFEDESELDLLRFEAITDYFAKFPESEKLNPDVWMPASSFPKGYAEKQLALDIENVKAVAEHIRNVLIPNFVNAIAEGAGIDPVDGIHLTALMHSKGINMRHLGRVYTLAQEANLKNLAAVALEEAIARSLKTQLRSLLEAETAVEKMPEIVEAFVSGFRGANNTSIIAGLTERLQGHFGFKELPESWKSVNLPRLSLLRLLSLKSGLQWNDHLKLVAINPVVRYSFPRSLTAADAIEAGRISLEAAVNPSSSSTPEKSEAEKESSEDAKPESDNSAAAADPAAASEKTSEESQAGENAAAAPSKETSGTPEPSSELLEQTLSVVAQAAGVYTQIYGASHAEVAHVLNQVATMYYEYGNDAAKAVEYARKAITIAERVKGIDSYDVIVMYNNLAYFERSAGNWATTIEISKRILSTLEQFAWPGFSDAPTVFDNVAVMLLQTQKAKLQKLSLDWFKRGIELANDTPSGPSGLIWFQYAQAQIFQQDFKNASRSMEASYNAFKAKNGPEDPSTKEVKNHLEQLLKITINTAHNEAQRARVMATMRENTHLKSALGKKGKKALRGNLKTNINEQQHGQQQQQQQQGQPESAGKKHKKSSHKKKSKK